MGYMKGGARNSFYAKPEPFDAVAITAVRTEKAYEKHAWIIFLVIGGFHLIFGIFRTFTDVGDDAKIASMSTVFWAVFVVAVAAVPYKSGKSWSWYLLWALPVRFGVFGSFIFLFSSGAGNTADAGYFSFWVLLSLLGLLLPYRKFFPRKQA